MTKEYLAWINVGGGSAWGRSGDKSIAIETAVHSLKDWNRYYEVSNKDVTVRVIDITGYDEVIWEHNDIVNGRKPDHMKFEEINRKVERIVCHTPNWKRNKR